MNPTKYEIKITTSGLSVEELPEIMAHIKSSLERGFVNGFGTKSDQEYEFTTTEV